MVKQGQNTHNRESAGGTGAQRGLPVGTAPLHWLRREAALSVTLVIVTVLVLVFLGFDLLLNDLLHQRSGSADIEVLHSLFITRGIVITGLIAMWGWYLVRQRYARVDQAMRRWEDFYADQANLLREPILFLNRRGLLIQWNEAAEQILGAENLRKGEPDPSILEEDRERFMELLDELAGVRSGENVSRRIELVCTDASGARIAMTNHVSAIRDIDGEVVGFIVLKVNILPVIEEASKLATLEKYAAIGNMTSAIAHQLNTPLNSILLSIEMLGDSYPEIDTDELAAIKAQVADCREHVRRLLRIARDPAGGGQREPFCLSEIVDFLANMYRRVLKTHGIKIVKEGDPHHGCDGCGLIGDPYAMRQALMNLIGNAADVLQSRGGGVIRVGCRFVDGEARITVADDGPGIPADIVDRIWEPFFTTKESGTGLGLAVVRRIVTDMGGYIDLQTGAQGTVFDIHIPTAGAGGQADLIQLEDIGLARMFAEENLSEVAK